MIRAVQFQPKRTGSTFLQKAIDSHPDVMGIDEVFVNMARKEGMRKSGFVPFLRSDINDAGEYIREVIYKTYPNKHTIFKLMYNQIDYHGGLLQFVNENKTPMIHLMRKNLVKQVISGITAATTKHDPIVISPQSLMNAVVQADKDNRRYAKLFKDNIKLTLYYEDIIGEKISNKTYISNNINISVCGFFKTNQYQLFAETKKKNKDDISVYLPNIEGIRKVFEGSKFEWMLS